MSTRWRKKNTEENYGHRLNSSILPGGQAREYTVQSTKRVFNAIDLLGLIAMLHLLWTTQYMLALIGATGWFLLKRRQVRRESILVIRDVGIQVKTVYWDQSSATRFIDRPKIDDIVILEGISFWQIKSYIAIIVKNEDTMVIVFENLLPKLEPTLLQVYQGSRSIIFSKS
ncbi:GPI-GlcNAc transferase complex, PIG-H component-domain-containing protein [Sporodiniella umbellata]|nr:GPI-GlcNAc transferase complex, PIG-H component-domain-containing protein [Sporodiniella umbellata]